MQCLGQVLYVIYSSNAILDKLDELTLNFKKADSFKGSTVLHCCC